MTTKTYNRVRYVTQIFLPALATFLVTVGEAWGLEIGTQIGTTIAAIVTLLSGLLGACSAIYDKEGGKNDNGDFDADNTDDLLRFVRVSNMAGEAYDEQEDGSRQGSYAFDEA